MLSFAKFPKEIALEVAGREKTRRKACRYTQSELASRAGISLSSLKRFEQLGEISFVSLLKIADVLDSTDAFDNLFAGRIYNSIEDVINENRRKA